jgi:hypothetical protein
MKQKNMKNLDKALNIASNYISEQRLSSLFQHDNSATINSQKDTHANNRTQSQLNSQTHSI